MITAYWEYFIQQVNSIEVNTVSSIFKLSLSLLLGCLVGFERKRKGQIAGVRTFALISMGATLAMILSIYVPQEYLGLKNGDPGRIAAQVVTGIGFLGAGAIIQMKGSVRGLTTAAGIWIIAAIGMAVGVGLYSLSLAATALVLVVLLFVLLIAIPAVKIWILAMMLKLAAAIAGIVSDRRITSCMDQVGEGGLLVLRVLLTASGLFLITIAIAAITTNRGF